MARQKGSQRRSWDEWFRLAKRYKETHGDLLVPKSYITPEGARLGRWIDRQRARYNEVPSAPRLLYPDEIALLNSIGMVWKLEYRHDWQDWLRALDVYGRTHPDMDIPKSYVQGEYALGNWVSEQRKARCAGRLTESQIADLDARGILWSASTRPRAWEDWFEDARAYHGRHGDLMVPPDYRTEDGRRLGLWIYAQRDIYMGRRTSERLTPERAAALEEIGMVWEPEKRREDDWERMYAWVSDYARAHGSLPLWPRGMKSPDGRSASGWIAMQRAALARGGIDPDRAKRLSAIGIVAARSAAQREQEWETMYDAVASYHSKNGGLPAHHRDEKAPDGRLMSRWIQSQKQAARKGSLPPERVQRLARLGIVDAAL